MRKLIINTILIFAFSIFGCTVDSNQSQLESELNNNNETTSSSFKLTSSVLTDQKSLPDSLKCQRDGGTGESPPIEWSNPPEGTKSFAVSMHHYPKGTEVGVDNPSHYWLLWNLSSDLRSLEQGNPESIGTEGSDKDGKNFGYTSPCSPEGGGEHSYTITIYALSDLPSSLGDKDSIDIKWENLTKAISEITLASSELTFTN